MKTIKLLILLLLVTASTYAQKPETKIVSAQASEEWTSRESETDIKRITLDKAITEALEKAFGRMYIQGNSTYIRNEQTGESVKTSTNFDMVSNTYVKGKVLQIIDEKYDLHEQEYGKGKKKYVVKTMICKVKIEAIKIDETAVAFECQTLGQPHPNAGQTDFKEEDAVFLYFSSPEKGYISVYLDDTNVSELLLPWRDMPDKFQGGIPVEPNKKYVFFSSKEEHQFFADDYRWGISFEFYNPEGSSRAIQRLFVLYSKQPLNKPKLKEELSIEMLTDQEKEDNWSVPSSMKSEDFQRWLITNRQKRADLQVKIIDVVVSK